MEVMYCFVIFLYSFKNASILLIIIVCAIGDGSVSRNEHELSLTSSIWESIVILMIWLGNFSPHRVYYCLLIFVVIFWLTMISSYCLFSASF